MATIVSANRFMATSFESENALTLEQFAGESSPTRDRQSERRFGSHLVNFFAELFGGNEGYRQFDSSVNNRRDDYFRVLVVSSVKRETKIDPTYYNFTVSFSLRYGVSLSS
jgi:hypothetical protein